LTSGYVESSLDGFALDPRSLALLVVDMQNDFCHEQGFFARAGHDVSPCRAAAEQTGRLVPDVRRSGVPVIWTRMIAGEQPELKLAPIRFRAPRESGEFVEGVGGTLLFAPGSWGAELVDGLPVEPGDLVVDKPTYDALFATGLEEELRRRGVDTLAVAGVTSHCCVDATVRAAFVRGFNVLVLSDCVAAFGAEQHLNDATLEVLALLFAVVAPAAALAQQLRERRSAVGQHGVPVSDQDPVDGRAEERLETRP
jgi:ureidoacrylate peracid hydrolase